MQLARRELLVAITAVSGGCLERAKTIMGGGTPTPAATPAVTTTETPSPAGLLSLPSVPLHDLEEDVDHGRIIIQAAYADVAEKASYDAPGEGGEQTFDPPDKHVVVVGIKAENLASEQLSWPNYEQFTLITPTGEYDPVTEFPDGTSVERIRSNHIRSPKSVGIDGLSPLTKQQWDQVYFPDGDIQPKYAIKWSPPDGDPIVWGFDRPR